jgi:hypothetical protein
LTAAVGAENRYQARMMMWLDLLQHPLLRNVFLDSGGMISRTFVLVVVDSVSLNFCQALGRVMWMALGNVIIGLVQLVWVNRFRPSISLSPRQGRVT